MAERGKIAHCHLPKREGKLMESRSREAGPAPQCTRCIAATQGCCVTPFEDEWKIILLPDEVESIAALARREPATFVDKTPLVPDQREQYLKSETNDPLWASLFARWPRPTGFKDACPFLSRAGCTLPYDGKPFLCQVYPIEFNLTLGILFLPALDGEESCDVTRAARSPRDVADCFGDNLEFLQRRLDLFRQRALKLLGKLEEKVEGRRADARAAAGASSEG
jgi:Fe-S-cluster containining protein